MCITTSKLKLLKLIAVAVCLGSVVSVSKIAVWGSNSQPGDLAAAEPVSNPNSNKTVSPKSPEAVATPNPALARRSDEARYIGAGSCAARACHGSPVLTRRGESNSAYAIWAANDPHAQAYAVLFTPESQRMAQALNLGDAQDAAAKADRCLACHSLPVSGGRSADAIGDVSTLLSDGVSCEACHGPAEKYLSAHTMQGWHPPGDPQFDPSLGMKNTVDIAARAKVCVGCHVGQPDAEGQPWRDVNHDLIAAGHPRLNFDFAAYMATLPAHWNAKKHPERFDELPSLVAGQFITADAALKVLEGRANAANEAVTKERASLQNTDKYRTAAPLVTATWPEFAEYDCFACHHDLHGKSWRQQLIHPNENPLRPAVADSTDAPQPKRGTPGWGTWYFATPRILALTPGILPQADAKQWLASLNQLALSMQTPSPEPRKVASLAHDSAANLETAWSASPWSALSSAPTADSQAMRSALLKSLAAEFKRHRPSDWDQFVQYYLALVALERSQNPASTVDKGDSNTDAHSKLIDEVLLGIRNRLSFPADDEIAADNSENPSTKSSVVASKSILRILRQGFNSPMKFDPDAKQDNAAPGDLAGKSLVELFDEAFKLMGANPSA
jgi:Cytochrome c554 and c-prime